MKTTKKVTLSAMMIALGAVLMRLGVFIEVLDLTVCAMASLMVVFIYLEIGSYYPWLVWIATTIVTAITGAGIVAAEYFLVFGIYPLLKSYIERLPRWSWFLVKLSFINAVIWILFAISDFLLGQNFFGEETPIMTAVVYVLMNVAFIAYDLFITVMVRFYYEKLRPRIKNLLK